MSPINLCTVTKTNHEILIETISIRLFLNESPLIELDEFKRDSNILLKYGREDLYLSKCFW